ncbi:AsmA family protein [Limnobacter sp.]|uniref:AsmA family protein n=1 Tax=Limnobacter sp. TaxID=2003368 RepID=UPI0035163487
MKKALAWGVGIVLGVPVVLAATAAILVSTLDEQTLLAKASDAVRDKYQRELSFSGPAKLSWFPSIGARLQGVALTEPNSGDAFLKVEELQVSLALMPLFKSEVVVDAVQAKGLVVNVVQDVDGKFNFDDLLAASKTDAPEEAAPEADPEQAGQSLNFSVDSVALSDLNLRYTNLKTGQEAQLSNFAVQTGRLQPGVPANVLLGGNIKSNKPKADLNLDVSTQLEFGMAAPQYANFENLKASVLGELDQQVADVNLQADRLNVNAETKAVLVDALKAAVKATVPGVGKLDATVAAPMLELNEQQARGEAFTLKAKLEQAARTVDVDLTLTELSGNLRELVQGKLQTAVKLVEGERTVNLGLNSPLTAKIQTQYLELAKLAGQLEVKDPALPKQSASMPLAGSFALNNSAQTVDVVLNSQFESTKFDLKADVKNFTKPFITAVLNADTLDIDALFPPKPKAEGKAADGKEPAADTPVDLSALKGLNMDVTANIGKLKVSNVKAANLKAKAVARDGLLTVQPLQSNLYSGNSTGSITVNANTQRIAINQQVRGVQIQPFMKDLLDKDMLEGRGDVTINLTTQGNTVNALKAGLNGTVAVALQDGAVKGINLAERFRNTKAMLTGGSNTTSTSDTTQKTDFSSMALSLVFKDGVGSSNDLNLMAPLFRIGGQGQVNLVNNTVDYLARTSIVATSTGQGGKTLDAGLNGVTVPVRVFGPFANIQWELQFKDLAKEAAKAKLQPKIDEKREELKGKAEDKLRDAFKGFLNR